MSKEKIFITLQQDYDFAIHIYFDKPFSIEGEVYPIQKYFLNHKDKKEDGWGYIKSQNGDIFEGSDPDDSCKKLFKFSYCWRGCWEGRIYFTDDEYWSEELSLISELWNILVLQLKQKIEINI